MLTDGVRRSGPLAHWFRLPGQQGLVASQVAIARAIAKKPEIMLCDEPTGALDSKTGILVLEALSHVNRELGTTMAIITHNAVIREIIVDLLAADAVRIRPGTVADIVEWGGDEAIPATVRKIEPAAFMKVSALGIEEQRVNAVLDFAGDDSGLGHGFRVVADLVVWACEVCLQIPISALFRSGERWHVFKLEDSRLDQVGVGVGRMNDETAQVLDGLSAGDVVVIHPADTLADKALAQVRD